MECIELSRYSKERSFDTERTSCLMLEQKRVVVERYPKWNSSREVKAGAVN